MNNNRSSKPNLPNTPKPSKLLAPTRLRWTMSSLAFQIPKLAHCINQYELVLSWTIVDAPVSIGISGKKNTVAVVPLFDHLLWQQLPHVWGPIEGPLLNGVCCSRRVSGALSLSRWRKLGLPLALWQESGPDFKGFTKAKWSCHQSLGFSKVWLVTCF